MSFTVVDSLVNDDAPVSPVDPSVPPAAAPPLLLAGGVLLLAFVEFD